MFVGALVAVFTVLGSTMVGAADSPVAGSISQTGSGRIVTDGTRGIFVVGSGGAGAITPAGFAGRLGGDGGRGIFVVGGGGAGTISLTGSARVAGSGNERGIFVPSGGGSGMIFTGSNSFTNAGITRVSGTTASGGAGTITTFSNGR